MPNFASNSRKRRHEALIRRGSSGSLIPKFRMNKSIHIFKIKGGFIMSIKYRPVKYVLNYRETKPEVWKAQKLTFPIITEDALIEYIANSAALPKSTVKSCALALAEAIVYFVINGHCVTFDDFGSFYLKMKVKVAQSKKECDTSLIKRITIGFSANTQLSSIINKAKVQKVTTLTT